MTDCVFCKIIAGEIPAKKIFEDDDVFAFADIAPIAPCHILVVPKKHIDNIFCAEDSALMGKLMTTAARLLKEAGYGERGGRFVINCKADGLQSVPHLHVHALGGRQFSWPPG